MEESPAANQQPDLIVINHGTNDRHQPSELFVRCYENLLDRVYRLNPNAHVVATTLTVVAAELMPKLCPLIF